MKGKTERSPNRPTARVTAVISGGTLARTHAWSVDPAVLRGYIRRNTRLTRSLQAFATAYADQTEADFARVREAASDVAIAYEPSRGGRGPGAFVYERESRRPTGRTVALPS